MARQAKKKGIKFIITGIGGDEAFKIDSREKIGFQGSEEESFRKKFLSPSFFTSFLQKAFQEAIPNPLPLPLVPYSVLSSNLARNNIYIRQNIWPFAPLAHPNFIDFCRSLPISERKNKKILRDYLQQQGYPLSLTCPVDNENFASFFENTMRRSEVKDFFWRLLANSQLEKLGLIKREEVMSCYLKYQKKKNKINPLYFYTIITAEILLQSFD
jgi:asparagine synthetase B (glutamine-hydrolysing)